METQAPRQRKWRWLAVVLAVGFIGLLFSTAGPFRGVAGEAATAGEANRRLWNCHVPEDATDVWYRSNYSTTQVECTLPKASFLAWCEEKEWSPQPLEEPAYWNSLRANDVVVSSPGWAFNEMNGDSGYSGLYDEKSGRCFVLYSAR